MLSFSIEDATGHLYLSAFDEAGAPLLKITANEMAALRETDEVACRNVFLDATHKTYNFKIKAFQTVFNVSGTGRIRRNANKVSDLTNVNLFSPFKLIRILLALNIKSWKLRLLIISGKVKSWWQTLKS
jgi:hypothetical protein